MTNGSGERLDRIERILGDLARGQEKFQEQVARGQEKFQEQLHQCQGQLQQFQEQVAKSHLEMAARQQYHDEAFERHDAEMRTIREAIAADAENIRALVRIAEPHHRRLEGLEGGDAT